MHSTSAQAVSSVLKMFSLAMPVAVTFFKKNHETSPDTWNFASPPAKELWKSFAFHPWRPRTSCFTLGVCLFEESTSKKPWCSASHPEPALPSSKGSGRARTPYLQCQKNVHKRSFSSATTTLAFGRFFCKCILMKLSTNMRDLRCLHVLRIGLFPFRLAREHDVVLLIPACKDSKSAVSIAARFAASDVAQLSTNLMFPSTGELLCILNATFCLFLTLLQKDTS